MSRIRIIGVVSALVFWLLAMQGSALELGCDGDCTEAGFSSAASAMVGAEHSRQFVREDLGCKKTSDRGSATERSCETRFGMAHANKLNSAVSALGRWWMIIAMLSLAFVGFFYLHWESLDSVDDAFLEDVDEQTQDLAAALSDVVRGQAPDP